MHISKIVPLYCLLEMVLAQYMPMHYEKNYLNKFNHVIMDNNAKYQLYWRINSDTEMIDLEVHVGTVGWVGIGMNRNGDMQGADIVVAGVRDTQPYLYDMHADSNSMPMMDAQQDYKLVFARQNESHTVVGMKRSLNTGDERDWKITNEAVSVIWAFHDQDAYSNNNFMMHLFRDKGSSSIILTESKTPESWKKTAENIGNYQNGNNDQPNQNGYGYYQNGNSNEPSQNAYGNYQNGNSMNGNNQNGNSNEPSQNAHGNYQNGNSMNGNKQNGNSNEPSQNAHGNYQNGNSMNGNKQNGNINEPSQNAHGNYQNGNSMNGNNQNGNSNEPSQNVFGNHQNGISQNGNSQNEKSLEGHQHQENYQNSGPQNEINHHGNSNIDNTKVHGTQDTNENDRNHDIASRDRNEEQEVKNHFGTMNPISVPVTTSELREDELSQKMDLNNHQNLEIENQSNKHELISDFKPMRDTMTHSAVLDSEGNFWLYWFIGANGTITFEVHVKTLGWAAIGFSPNGGMAGSDIVSFWIDELGQLQYQDRHASANDFPSVDEQNDYMFEGGMRDDDNLVVRFTRDMLTCDSEDYELQDATVRVIWAFDNHMPEGEDDLKKHMAKNRGSKSTYLFGRPKRYEESILESEAAADLETDPSVMKLDFLAQNVDIPAHHHTLYWCMIFELPNKKKHHIIRYEPLIQKGHEPYVHHMVMYTCDKDMSEYVGKSEPCFDIEGSNRSAMYRCTSKFFAGWAVGGLAHIFPEELGIPIFEEGGDKFIMLEMHYDNSDFVKNIIDNSGLRLYMTSKLRPLEIGTMVFGNPINQVIPPEQDVFVTYAYCTSDCTNALPPEGVYIYSGLLHTHLAGVGIRMRHIRNGIELAPILQDDHYDFNYQSIKDKPDPVKILPGDEFIVECYYTTKNRTNTTFGGFSTLDEMCLVYMEYYPKSNTIHSCLGVVDPEDRLGILGAEVIDTMPVTIKDENGVNMTMKEWVSKKVDWREKDVRKFQEMEKSGKHWVMCVQGKNDDEDNPQRDQAEPVEDVFDGDEKYKIDFFQSNGGPLMQQMYTTPTNCPVPSIGIFQNFEKRMGYQRVEKGEIRKETPVPYKKKFPREKNYSNKSTPPYLVIFSACFIITLCIF